MPSHDKNISAYEAYYKRPWDFKACPMAPLGVPIISHDKPAERPSWAQHGSEGFYVGPIQDHYRCFQVLISHTGALRITDTIDWQPDAIHLPGFSFLEILEHNINKLEHTLKGVSTTIDDLNIDDYNTLREIYYPQPLASSEGDEQSAVPTSEGAEIIPTGPSETNPPTSTCDTIGPFSVTSDNTVTFADISHKPSAKQKRQRKKTKRDNTLLQQKGNSQIQIPTIIVPENILPASDTANTILDYQPTPTPEIIRPPVYTTRSTAKLAAVMAASVIGILCGVFRDELGKRISYKKAVHLDQSRWQTAGDEEQIRLVEVMKVMTYIPIHELPSGIIPTYFNQVCSEKGATARVRGTLGGDRLPKDLNKQYDVAAYTADMPAKKILLNHVVSTGNHFVVCDIKDFFINQNYKLSETAYMYINEHDISDNIKVRFKLDKLLHNKRYLVKITGAIYGHPEAAKISQIHLAKVLTDN